MEFLLEMILEFLGCLIPENAIKESRWLQALVLVIVLGTLAWLIIDLRFTVLSPNIQRIAG